MKLGNLSLENRRNLPLKVKGPGSRNFLRLHGDPLGYLDKLRCIPDDVISFNAAGERIYLVKDPELIHEVLVTKARHFHKGRSLEVAREVFGNSLLTSEGRSYLRQRRLMQPAFHSERINSFAETMVEHVNKMTAQWKDGQSCDFFAEMMRFTLGIVGKTLLGSDVGSELAKMQQGIDTMMHVFPLLMLPFGQVLQRMPLPVMKRLRRAKAEIDDVLYGLINARRGERADRGDLLSMLLAARDPENPNDKGMGDEEIRNQVMIIFLAGHETTTVAFCWTIYLLSQHPKIEARLHAELDRVLTNDRSPCREDLPQLIYTRKVLTESMRLYPPIWTVTRRAFEPCQLGAYDVPEKTLVQTSQWVMHRDARYFDAPAEFRPERWTPAFQASLPKFAYFPFSGGLRGCIGEGFAWVELVIGLAAMARRWRFRIDAPERVIPKPLFTLRFRNGLPVLLVRR